MRWCAGIVNHGSYDDLERCLAALAKQTRGAAAVMVYDTAEDPRRLEALRLAHPDVAFESGPNVGYAGGANRVIAGLVEVAKPVEFVLVLNPDVELSTDHAERLASAMSDDPDVAIGSGKLLRPDRKTIDSAGIVIPRHRRPRDRGSEQPDRGQFDHREYVDAASGAAMMIRVESIDSLSLDGELFDESFFAYHEDTDLCWRARRFGWSILYEPSATALHGRGWQRDRRGDVPIGTRRHSFKNHYLQLVKNESASGFMLNLPWLVAWEILRLGFVLLRDPAMVAAYRDAWDAMPLAWQRRAAIRNRIGRHVAASAVADRAFDAR